MNATKPFGKATTQLVIGIEMSGLKARISDLQCQFSGDHEIA
jgi:hypothetical protein